MGIEDLERAVAELPPEKLAEFRAWFETFEAAHFDAKIEADVRDGKLDKLAQAALEDFRQGRVREL